MASDIKAGRAYVELLLKDSKFRAGLQAAKAKMVAFGKATAMVGAAIGAAGAAATVYGLKQLLSMGDALDKMSARTGVSVEALSELKHAAEQSGAGMGDIEKAIRQMQKNGLDASQFDAAAAAIAAIADPAQRAQAAMDMWGKSGVKLLPMLNDLPALRQEARDLGLVMSGESASAAVKLGDQMANLWATVKAGAMTLGEIFVPTLTWAAEAVQVFATDALTAFRDMQEGIVGALNLVTSTLGAAWEYARSVTDTAVKAMSFAIINWEAILKTAVVGSQYVVVRFANETVHFFTEVIPATLAWFRDNWRDIFTDVVNFTATVAGNIWTNLKNLWEAIKGLFSGDGFSFEWTGLTEGFESAVKELPNIAEREIGPLEKSLRDQLDDVLKEADFAGRWREHSQAFDAALSDRDAKIAARRAGRAAGPATPALDLDLDAAQKKQREVFVGFSAALAAQQVGSGGGPVEKQTQLMKEQHRELVRVLKEGGGLS